MDTMFSKLSRRLSTTLTTRNSQHFSDKNTIPSMYKFFSDIKDTPQSFIKKNYIILVGPDVSFTDIKYATQFLQKFSNTVTCFGDGITHLKNEDINNFLKQLSYDSCERMVILLGHGIFDETKRSAIRLRHDYATDMLVLLNEIFKHSQNKPVTVLSAICYSPSQEEVLKILPKNASFISLAKNDQTILSVDVTQFLQKINHCSHHLNARLLLMFTLITTKNKLNSPLIVSHDFSKKLSRLLLDTKLNTQLRSSL